MAQLREAGVPPVSCTLDELPFRTAHQRHFVPLVTRARRAA
jgi:hypothetical protein